MKQSRRYIENLDKIDRNKEYDLDEAAALLVEFSKTKIDESIEMAINLGIDPKHADQIVRGTVSLPNGTGKDVKVVVVTKILKFECNLFINIDDDLNSPILAAWIQITYPCGLFIFEIP